MIAICYIVSLKYNDTLSGKRSGMSYFPIQEDALVDDLDKNGNSCKRKLYEGTTDLHRQGKTISICLYVVATVLFLIGCFAEQILLWLIIGACVTAAAMALDCYHSSKIKAMVKTAMYGELHLACLTFTDCEAKTGCAPVYINGIIMFIPLEENVIKYTFTAGEKKIRHTIECSKKAYDELKKNPLFYVAYDKSTGKSVPVRLLKS